MIYLRRNSTNFVLPYIGLVLALLSLPRNVKCRSVPKSDTKRQSTEVRSYLPASYLPASYLPPEETTTVIKLNQNLMSIRQPEMEIGGKGGEIIYLTGRSGLDAGFRCHAFDLREAFKEDVHIEKITPHVSVVGKNEKLW